MVAPAMPPSDSRCTPVSAFTSRGALVSVSASIYSVVDATACVYEECNCAEAYTPVLYCTCVLRHATAVIKFKMPQRVVLTHANLYALQLPNHLIHKSIQT